MSRQNLQVLYKFVVVQVKNIVCDDDGYPRYMKPFDRIIYDLYGLENFSERLSKLNSNRALRGLIDKIGLVQLVKLLQNKTHCRVLCEMVQIQIRRSKLRKKINKERSKEGATKAVRYAEKEYNDLKKFYDRGIKHFRKVLEIKNIHKAYKNNYKALRSFTGHPKSTDLYWDDVEFDGIGSVLDDDPYDDFDEDLFDDDDDSTILEEFMKELNGRSPRPSRKRRGWDSFDDADDSEDLEDFDDFDDNDEGLEELTEKVDALCGQMQNLANAVQQNTATQNRPKRQATKRRTQQTVANTQPNQSNLEAAVSDIQNCMNLMIDKLSNLDCRLTDFEENVVIVDDEEDNDGGLDDPYENTYQNQFARERLARQQAGVRPVQSTTNSADIINAINNAPMMTGAMIDSLEQNIDS